MAKFRVAWATAIFLTGVLSGDAFAERDPFLQHHVDKLGPDSPSFRTASINKKAKLARPELEFSSHTVFPNYAQLLPRVEFWKKIYTKYSTTQVVIHDKENLNVIYEVVDLKSKFKNPVYGSRHVRKYMKKRKKQIAVILRKLYKNKGKARTAEEKAILNKLGGAKNYRKFNSASRRVRSQLGLSDRFREGLERSGMYLNQMKSIFRSYGLPEELTALPHVESSFNYNAYSKVGAAGIWQFTRGTGRRYMKINYTVDDRRDPILSTHAAAKLLKENYTKLGSWPLAITAYNHGQGGMARAKRKFGYNFPKIVKHYKSRTFGFASSNFYAEFLAALEVATHYRSYFGKVDFLPERKSEVVKVPYYLSAVVVAQKLHMPLDQLRSYNLSLRNSVWKGHRYIPRGFKLRVPANYRDRARQALASIPQSAKFSEQKHNGYHIVRRGDTLSTVARHYRTSVKAFKDLNGLRSSRIYVKQRLRVPGKRAASVKSAAIKPPTGNQSYKVRRGDSLTRIARKHGITLASLANMNNMRINSMIHPGQWLAVSVEKPTLNVSFVSEKPAAPAPEKTVIAPEPADAKSDLPAAPASEAPPVTAPVAEGGELKIRADYFALLSYKDDVGRLMVMPEETPGHYAEWARIGINKLKTANRGRSMRRIKIGDKIKVPMSKVSQEDFERKRLEYHLNLLEDFLDAYKVESSKEVFVKRGQSLWDLCVNEHDSPMWLVQLYNPGKRLDKVRVGDAITIPTVLKK